MKKYISPELVTVVLTPDDVLTLSRLTKDNESDWSDFFEFNY